MAADPQARFGCKGKNKFWYGYKEHASVDMQSGLINKIAATLAEVTDVQGMKHVCPKSGAVYADKGYCVGSVKTTQYERVFTHRNKRVRYKGTGKGSIPDRR